MNKLTLKNQTTIALTFVLCLLLMASYSCDSNNDPEFSQEIINELDAELEVLFEQIGAPGILVGLYVPGVGTWERSMGVSNLETQAPFDFDMHVRIGSVTKTFTTQLILMLQDRALLSLDDPISMYIDDIPNGDEITLRNLGNMTSGLVSYTFDEMFQESLFTNPQQTWIPQELIDIGVSATNTECPVEDPPPPCFEPGNGWSYSNTNTVLLGLVIEEVTDQSYGEVLKELILDPLGLSETSHPTTAALPEPFSHGYSRQGSPDDSLQDTTFWNPTWGFAVGDMISTFGDLRRWARALGTGELLSSESRTDRFTPVTLPPLTSERDYAFGVGLTNGWRGHSGELPGYNTLVMYRPDIRATLVVLVNNDDDVEVDGRPTGPVYVVGNKIIEIAEREAPLGDIPDDVPWEDDSLED